MDLKVEIVGDIDALLRVEYLAGERAVTQTMRTASVALKENWRSQIRGAGLGSRLANVIRSDVYPKGRQSLNAAAMVWAKAPEIIGSHERGALIRSTSGFWLAIPTKAAGKGSKGGRITPIEWEQRTGRALRFVYFGGRIAKLVDDGTTQFRRLGDDTSFTQSKAGVRKRRLSKLIFVLVPQVRLRKKLNLFAAADAAHASLPAQIIANWRTQR